MDGSIQHSGDEREGDEAGDDEKIKVDLNRVPSNVQYICFVLNSYSGQELDDVSKASCHLFDAATNVEVAKYAMTNTAELNRHTALLVACLYRTDTSNDWRLWIMAKPMQGKKVNENTQDVLAYLRSHSPPPVPVISHEEEEIVVTAIPGEIETVEAEQEIEVVPMEELLQKVGTQS